MLFFLYGCSDTNTNWEKSSEIDKMSDKEIVSFKRKIVSEEGNKFDLTLDCPSEKNATTELYLAGSSLKTYSSSVVMGQFYTGLNFNLDGILMNGTVTAIKVEDQS